MTLRRHGSEQVEDHLELNICRLDATAKARAEVISYTEQKAAKIDDGGGAASMELDAYKAMAKVTQKGRMLQEKATPRRPRATMTRTWFVTCARRKEEPKESKDGYRGPKGKGAKGKPPKSGKGKAHSFEEGAEDQEWPEGEGCCFGPVCCWQREHRGDHLLATGVRVLVRNGLNQHL